jgi:hypothetical protein
MELIERYLQAVKFALPQDQRDDIIKELRQHPFSNRGEGGGARTPTGRG